MPAPKITRDGNLIKVVLPVDNRLEARKLAMREAGTVVANTGVPTTREGRGFAYVYAAVERGVRKPAAKPAAAPRVKATPVKAAPVVTGEEDRLAYLERMVLELSSELASARNAAPDMTYTEAQEHRAATRKGKPAKPAYVPSPDQARRKVHACGTCQDLGVVRGSGSRKGQPYVTANGAAQATSAVKCPACKGKARRAA